MRYNVPVDKVFRDPVHNLIRFDRKRDQLVLALVETREFQRLRHIRQMGVSQLVYPGATHTRFSHALGVASLMKRVLEHFLESGPPKALARELGRHRELLLAAALLHDVGHFPFSHLLEDVAEVQHEDWTARLIHNRKSEIGRTLHDANPRYPEQIVKILQHTFSPSFAVKLISSQLDVDRMEYLLRDSFHTGVRYGYFDAEWLIHSLRLVPVQGEWELAIDQRKGIHAAEAYVLARYYMYQQVYHHKTSRAADVLVKKILQRAAALARDPQTDLPLSESLRRLLVGEKSFSTEDHFRLDDIALLSAFQSWERSSDLILADLCRRLSRRRLFKLIDVPERLYRRHRQRLERLVRSEGFDPDYYLVLDHVSDDPYSDRYLVAGQPTTEGILLVRDDGRLIELSQASDIIRAIREKTFAQERLCVPGELRVKIQRLLGL